MPKPTYARCRHCGGHRDEVGLMSHTRLCIHCAKLIVEENMDGLHYWNDAVVINRWRLGVVRSVGGVLLDELEQTA